MELETVKVVSPVSEDNPHGYVIINKYDLTDEHELFDAETEGSAATSKPNSRSRGTKAKPIDPGEAEPQGSAS